MPVYDHAKPPVVAEEWPDHLSRRVMSPTKRLDTLSMSHDGRIAIGLSSTVSVLNPGLVFRVVKAPVPTETHEERKPLEYALLDTDARVARGIRPPVVGHEIAFEPDHRKPKGSRKDTTLGRGDIAHLSWTSSRAGSVMFAVNGEGYCFVAVPRYGNTSDETDGTWGGLLGPWRYKKAFPEISAGRSPPSQAHPSALSEQDKGQSGDGDAPGRGGTTDGGDSANSANRAGRGRGRRGRGARRGDGGRATFAGNGDLFPQNQVRCVSFARVFKSANSHSNHESEASAYAILGRKDGTFVFSFQGWKAVGDTQEPVLSLHSGWSASLACLEDVEYAGKSMTLIAVGGAFGELIIYGLWFAEFSGGLFMLTSEALWQAEPSLLLGTVTSLSWNLCTSQDQLRLAVGSGNNITVLDWSNISLGPSVSKSWANPDVHRISEAHESLVSSLQVLVDGSFLSSSLDGKICRWRLEKWEHGGGDEHLHILYCGLLHSGLSSEPVMGLERTPFGFGVAAMTTANQIYSEVNEPNDDAKNKYAAGSRRSLLSLYIQPALQGVPEVVSRILTSVEMRATTRRYVGEAVVTWDIELFLEQLEGEDENSVLEALRQRFYGMLKHLKDKSIPNVSKESFHHYSRVALCLSQLIMRTGGTDIIAIESMEQPHGELANSVRSIHYDACLASFLRGHFPADKLSIDEFRSLESMCQFVTLCKRELFWNASATLERVRLVREALSPRIARGESTIMPCAICGPDPVVPLVSDAEDANSFYCASNDCFVRCVLTGLPCIDVVPLICYACEARAVVRDFDPYEERGEEFRWIEDIGRCPVCLCPLLPSSVEIQ